MDWEPFGRVLIITGLFITAIGVVLIFLPRVPLLGRLPGDIVIQRESLTCIIPLATSLLLSILLTIILNIIARMIR